MPEGQTAPPPLPKWQPSFGKRNSTIIKLLGVGALVLLLLVPLAMITGVLKERLQRRNEAVAEITSSWGSEQNVIGPVLGIPYQYKFKTVKEVAAPDGKMERREVEENGTAIAYFLPERLHITGNVETQMLHRGIYDAAVFRAQVTLAGKFAPPDFGPLKIDLKDVQWKDAFVSIAVNDLRGTREALMLDWGGARHALLPGSQVPGYTTGATALLGSDQPLASETQFSIPLDFNGSEGIYFAPFGVQNEAILKSNWPDPAFRGAFCLRTDRCALTDSMRNGKCLITAVIIRSRGRVAPAMSGSVFFPSRIRDSVFSSCRFWTRIDMSNARSNTVCSFSYSFLQPSFSSKSRRDRKFIRFNI